MPRQLALPLEQLRAQGRENFIVAPCNEVAVRFIDRWPDWPGAAALYGAPGSGKSHLVAAWLAVSKGVAVRASGLKRAALPSADAIAIEDVDTGGGEERDHALLALFERRAGSLLFTGARAPTEWPVALPDLKSRFASLVAFPMWEPDDTLLSAIARKLFADRQLEVDDAVIARMLRSLDRTPAAIARFVARADQKALSERRKITEKLVSELLDDTGA